MDRQNQIRETNLSNEELAFLINLIQAHRGSRNMLIGFGKMTSEMNTENRKYDILLRKIMTLVDKNV